MEATDVSIRGDLVITRGFALSDWYLIVRKGDEISRSFLCDAAVEGPSLEMRQLADAIVARKRQVFRRCAVDATEELVRLWSPRNSVTTATVTHETAARLARHIEATLAAAVDPPPDAD